LQSEQASVVVVVLLWWWWWWWYGDRLHPAALPPVCDPVSAIKPLE